VHEPEIGTFATWRRVRDVVAIRGKADVARTLRFCSKGPITEVAALAIRDAAAAYLVDENCATALLNTAGIFSSRVPIVRARFLRRPNQL
jgi:hypothetical protein